MRFMLAVVSLGACLSFAASGCGDASQATRPTYPVARPDAPDATAPSAADAAPREIVAEASDGGDAEPVTMADAAPPEPPSTSACNDQAPQDFLIRKNFFPKWNAEKEEAKQRNLVHQQAIRYRTEHYGYFAGFGSPSMNPHPPSFYVETIKWMNLPVTVHKKIVPALKCVEEEIKRVCADKPYTPHALGGIRHNNTYHTGEITNHAYAIAMDIDPALNSCCGCVPPWNSNPLCHRPIKTEYDRMAMPECWVHAFERFGFYWLGHDVLQDTMHFEFLGDPDKILKNAPPTPAP